MKTKKISKFWLTFAICWVIALVALFIALAVVRTYLSDYEDSQPKYVAEEIFEKYFSEPDFTAVLNHTESTRNKFESIDSLSAYLSELVGDKELSYHEISSGLDTGT